LTAQLRHLGIIMDGNGRWAQMRRRPRTFGHIKGARTAKKIITACREMGVPNLTLYAFSTENWSRPDSEVQFLWRLLSRYLRRETAALVRQDIRLHVIGDYSRLPKDLVEAAQETMQATAKCQSMNLLFALSYGSRQEIVETCQQLARQVATGDLHPDQINESLFANHLQTAPAPDVDLVIRTSGEQRLSNFLLWQAAYAELAFSKTLWPDFSRQELEDILHHFSGRDRRFGGLRTHHEQLSY